jgi:uncharacterized membrane protein YhaH (DUF805 family)
MSILSMFSLKGRLTRLPYVLVAVSILLVFAANPFIVRHLQILLQKLGVTLTLVNARTSVNIAKWLGLILPFSRLLIIPFMIVTVRRLHDIGFSGFLALPYVINVGLEFYVAWAQSRTLLETTFPDSAVQQVAVYLSIGTYYYGLALAFALCLIPSRKKPATLSTNAA